MFFFVLFFLGGGGVEVGELLNGGVLDVFRIWRGTIHIF